jgi:hypothetical protein
VLDVLYEERLADHPDLLEVRAGRSGHAQDEGVPRALRILARDLRVGVVLDGPVALVEHEEAEGASATRLFARRSFLTTCGVAKTILDLPFHTASLNAASVLPVRRTKSSSGSLMTPRNVSKCCMQSGRVGAMTRTLLSL